MTQDLAWFAQRAIGLHEKLGNCHPSLQRGQVWCRRCGHTQKVDSAECFRIGWPKCCGHTMTIDAPDA
jgi:Zn finger protein HypA/HybF involved in hydrogenase expression